MSEVTVPPAVAEASVHAVDLDSGAVVALDADRDWPLASVVKLPWAIALYRCADAGEVDLSTRLTIDPGHATPGPTGISAMHDPVELSLRDAAYLALSHSDNAAADALLSHVGQERVRLRCTEIGLPGAVARQPISWLYHALRADLGAPDDRAIVDRLARRSTDLTQLSVFRPADANSASARDLTRLIAAVWSDRAASATGCAAIRDALLRPAAPGRVARGLASDDVLVGGKTGTQLTLRHEAAWVGFPDGRSYALAVLTRGHDLDDGQAHDAAVGSLARQAIQRLRST